MINSIKRIALFVNGLKTSKRDFEVKNWEISPYIGWALLSTLDFCPLEMAILGVIFLFLTNLT